MKYKSIMLRADGGEEQINRCIELESKDKEIKDVKIQNIKQYDDYGWLHTYILVTLAYEPTLKAPKEELYNTLYSGLNKLKQKQSYSKYIGDHIYWP